MATLTTIDSQRRITLPKTATAYDHYIVDISPDGTITLTPAVIRSALEDALRAQPGYIEALERDAVDPSRDVQADWKSL